MSRCLKAIPSIAEDTSRFLVGSYTSNNSYLHTVTYDSEKNEMNIDEILNFGKYEEKDRIINEVTGIYTSINLEDVGNMPNDEMNYFVQVFNESNRKYELKFIKNIDNLDEIRYRRINSCDSDYLFE